MTPTQIIGFIRIIWFQIIRDVIIQMVEESASPVDDMVVGILDRLLELKTL